jgi:hypothetical protein
VDLDQGESEPEDVDENDGILVPGSVEALAIEEMRKTMDDLTVKAIEIGSPLPSLFLFILFFSMANTMYVPLLITKFVKSFSKE